MCYLTHLYHVSFFQAHLIIDNLNIYFQEMTEKEVEIPCGQAVMGYFVPNIMAPYVTELMVSYQGTTQLPDLLY